MKYNKRRDLYQKLIYPIWFVLGFTESHMWLKYFFLLIYHNSFELLINFTIIINLFPEGMRRKHLANRSLKKKLRFSRVFCSNISAPLFFATMTCFVQILYITRQRVSSFIHRKKIFWVKAVLLETISFKNFAKYMVQKLINSKGVTVLLKIMHDTNNIRSGGTNFLWRPSKWKCLATKLWYSKLR